MVFTLLACLRQIVPVSLQILGFLKFHCLSTEIGQFVHNLLYHCITCDYSAIRVITCSGDEGIKLMPCDDVPHSAIEQVRSQGKMAGALKRMFQQILDPEVPWIDHIDTLINRAVAGDGGTDWTQPVQFWGAFDFYVPASTG